MNAANTLRGALITAVALSATAGIASAATNVPPQNNTTQNSGGLSTGLANTTPDGSANSALSSSTNSTSSSSSTDSTSTDDGTSSTSSSTNSATGVGTATVNGVTTPVTPGAPSLFVTPTGFGFPGFPIFFVGNMIIMPPPLMVLAG